MPNHILFLTPDPPVPPLGGGTRSYNVLKAFAQTGIVDIAVLRTLSDNQRRIVAQLARNIISLEADVIPMPKTTLEKLVHLVKYFFPFVFTANNLSRQLDIIANHWSVKLPKFLQKLLFDWFVFWIRFKKPLPANTLGRESAFVAMKSKIEKLIQINNYSHVVLDFSYIYPLFKEIIPTGTVLITNSHNIEYSFYDQLILKESDTIKTRYLKYQKSLAQKHEIDGYRNSTLVFCCSAVDKDIILSRLNDNIKIKVIPNGVDCSYFHPKPNLTPYPSLLFTGTFGYQPNNDAVSFFIENVLPRIKSIVPDIKFMVAGRNAATQLEKYKDRDELMIFDSPDDMRPIFDNAWIYVVPLRHGSGTRLKILEAWSMQKPVVTTMVGIEGINFIDRADCVIADSPQQWLDAIETLLNDEKTRKDIAHNGWCKAHNQYDWGQIIEDIRIEINK